MNLSLGLDIGDGESCVALLSQESAVEPRVIPIAGSGSFVSAVARDEQGEIIIGENAVKDIRCTHKFVRFKSRFRANEPETNRALADFVRGIVKQLALRLQEMHLPPLSSGEYNIVVGCPAGWDTPTRERYLALLRDAGLPRPMLTSESRGALMYGINSSALGIPAQEATQSTLIVDIGSSTLDYAWVNQRRDTAVAGDPRLGGGLFDEYILKNAIDRAPDPKALAELLAKYPDARNELLWEARRLKEVYFTDEDTYAKEGVTARSTIYAEGRTRVTLEINGSEMWDNIANRPMVELGQNSFVTCLRTSLAQVRQFTAPQPPRYVLLTGGASRMEFFREECAKAFPGARLVQCDEPEYSIAKGLAYCGFEEAARRACGTALRQYAQSDAVETLVRNNLPALYRAMAEQLIPEIAEANVRPSFRRWRDGSLVSLDDLEREIAAQLPKTMGSLKVKGMMEEIIAAWIAPLLAKVQGEVNRISQSHGLKLQGRLSVDLSGTRTGGGTDAPNVDLSFVKALIAVVVAAVVGALCGGGGTALLVAGPVGVIIGVLAVLLLAFLGRKQAEKVIRGMDIPTLTRPIIAQEKTVLSERNLQKMKDVFVQKLTDEDLLGPQLTREIARRIDEQVTQIVTTELRLE